MTSTLWFVRIGSALLLSAPGALLAQGYPGAGAHPGMPGAAAQPPQIASEITKPMDLTDAQVKGFFAAMQQLRGLEEDAKGRVGTDPSKPEGFAASLRVSNEGMAILKKNGFKDVTEFQRVGFNAAMAHNIIEQGGKAAVDEKLKKTEAERAKALEQLRQRVTPEQFEMMKAQVNAGMGAIKMMHDVPEANVELMKKYGDQMESLKKE